MTATEPRSEPTLRRATMADADMLLAWVNMPDSLAAKLVTTAPIEHPTHVEWLSRRLGDPGTRMWIIETASGPAGQLRLERRDGAWEIDVFLAAGDRGRGIARQALRIALAKVALEPGGGTARARVRRTNAASQRLFAALGFRPTATHPDHIVLERNLEVGSSP